MSGHSKWATTKRRKSAVDAKRGKIFTKLTKEITVAARIGGGDADINPRLRNAIAEAKANNMPNENIERAIKRGTGELEGVQYEELSLEAYAPGGVALIMEILTDNRNRTLADVRHILSKSGGNLGERGCVSWMFEKKGLIVVDKDSSDEDEIFMLALEAGADDLKTENDTFDIYTTPETFGDVRNAIEEAGIDITLAEISMIPKITVRVEGKNAQQVLQLLETLDEHDDIQHVYSNFDVPDEMLDAAA
ncbi:TPA: YebC/PmpR family DNA-binding transcriptional regulator [Candidatus Poribacteria bacterium]|nr:YebC/PmpR family DNA-binding transcriptional regulator [Candidatus Poribacteria bacterium]